MNLKYEFSDVLLSMQNYTHKNMQAKISDQDFLMIKENLIQEFYNKWHDIAKDKILTPAQFSRIMGGFHTKLISKVVETI